MRFLEQAWYEKAGWLIFLWPIAKLFQLLAALRKAFLTGKARGHSTTIPVVVVGNITVGGTGKTPLIMLNIGKSRDLIL